MPVLTLRIEFRDFTRPPAEFMLTDNDDIHFSNGFLSVKSKDGIFGYPIDTIAMYMITEVK